LEACADQAWLASPRALDVTNGCPALKIKPGANPRGLRYIGPVDAAAELVVAPAAAHGAVEWTASAAPVPYPEALAAMAARVAAIRAGTAPELVWLLEHPPLYTAGTSAVPDELIDRRFPVYETGRGGRFTYHGPGQRVGYVMLDLRVRGEDVRRYVTALEKWLIRALARFGVIGEQRPDRIGVWVRRPDKGADREDKIAAIGVRVRRWVTFHGVSLNVAPDLSHYAGILPCGVADPRYGVTSLADLGVMARMADVDAALRGSFEEVFRRPHAARPRESGTQR
jgi:lipoyl(octanoyl) transferase